MKTGLSSIAVLWALMISGCAAVALDPQVSAPALPQGEITATATEVPSADLEVIATIPIATETATPSVTLEPPTTATSFVYAYGPSDFPEPINPLTGLPVDPPQLLERRPIVIKVTNFPRSVRPQWGLSQADHVYEYYIGDSMSRFVGVFYGKDAERVGPIRSARLFDAHVMRMYHGIFIFGWADDAVLKFLFAPDLKFHLIVEQAENCPPLCRFGLKEAYNTLYADTAQIAAYLTKRRTNNDRQNLSGLRFELETPASGNGGELFSIQYSLVSYHRWEYDPLAGVYLRYQETGAKNLSDSGYAPLMDSLTERQISATNVIVLLVPHQYFKKSNSTEIIDQPFMGQGAGYAFRDGQIYPLIWRRQAADQLPELLLPNDRLYPLKPGNTWFEIIGETTQFEQLEDGSWEFASSIP